MIYRLRKKFIKICTLSFLGVFVVLFSSIYVITFCQTTLSLDELADIVSENNGSFPEFQTPAQPAASDLRPAERNPEAPFTTRFFTVQFDGEGNFLSTDVRSIAASQRRRPPVWESRLCLNAGSGAGPGATGTRSTPRRKAKLWCASAPPPFWV